MECSGHSLSKEFEGDWIGGGRKCQISKFWVKMAKFPGLRPIGGNVENVIIGRSTLWDPSDYGHLENIIFITSSYVTINEKWSFCSASVSECQQYDIKTVHCFWDTNVYSKLIILHCTISEKAVVNKLSSRFIFSMGNTGLGGPE